MVDIWITAGNFAPCDIINPLFAAYDNDVYPNHIHIISPSNTTEQVKNAIPTLEKLARKEDQEMEITLHETPTSPSGFKIRTSEVFKNINETSIALDITGGPSVYATLLFQQAIEDDIAADHVYHLDYLLSPDNLDEDLYPLIPQTALTLTDILTDFGVGE